MVATATVVLVVALAGCSGDGGDAGDDDGRAVATSTTEDTRPVPDGPNLVVVMTDDQRLDAMAHMPRVAALLADEGAEVPETVASFPLCCPSRASYLTGQYTHNHGVQSNTRPTGGYLALTEPGTTFPAALAGAGYDTIHVGKYLNGYGNHAPPDVPPGWTEWHGSIDPSSYRYEGVHLYEDGVETDHEGEYSTDLYTDLAVAAIEERAGDERPFLLDVAYLAPHSEVSEEAREADDGGAAVPAERHRGTAAGAVPPTTPSFDEADVSDKPAWVRALPRIDAATRARIEARQQAAAESLMAVDEGVARIVEALEAAGELDDTYVVFTSDNGLFAGEHRMPADKERFYEPVVRVPLLVRGPGIAPGTVVGGVAANVDVAPTLLDLADVEPTRDVDGTSLVPALTGAGTIPADRAVLLEAGGPYSRDLGVRTDRWAYFALATGERELYDLDADPDQLDNRVDDPALADVQQQLAERLQALRVCRGEGCRAG